MNPGNRKQQIKGRNPAESHSLLAVFLLLLLQACAANPLEFPDITTDSTDDSSDESEATNATSARIVFHQNSFYTQVETSPSNSCAGDIRTVYKTIDFNDPSASTDVSAEEAFVAGNTEGFTGPIPFAESSLTAGETYKPAFIKNVSVDMTDANAPLTGNNAKSCALSDSVVPTSSCATFDFGAIGGVPTSLGGTLVLIGGVQGTNWTGISDTSEDTWDGVTAPLTTSGSLTVACGAVRDAASLPGAFGGDSSVGVTACAQSIFALGVDSIPASSLSSTSSSGSALAPGLDGPPESGENVSSWANLIPDSSSSSSDDAPGGRAGATVAYSTGAQALLVFGGSAVIGGLENEGTAQDTLETWVYDLKTQTWALKTPTVTAAQSILKMTDIGDTEDSEGADVTSLLSRQSGARAFFGYVPVPYSSLGSFSAENGVISDDNKDGSDRIWIIGGAASGIERYMTRKFNPTFGPEFVDALNGSVASNFDRTIDDIGTASGKPVQWAEAYPLQLMSSAATESYFRPDFDFDKDGDGDATNDPDDEPQWFGAARALTAGNVGTVITAGGFDIDVPDHTTAVAASGLLGHARRYTDTGDGDQDQNGIASTFLAVPNLLNGERVSPISWIPETDGANKVNWYGAPLLLPGIWTQENDVVYLGGTTCTNFMTDSTLAGDCNFLNPGSYIRLETDDNLFEVDALASIGTTGTMGGTTPAAAGMTGARGFTTATTPQPVLVVWGGMTDAATPANGNIHVLRDTGNDSGDITDLSWTELDASDSAVVSGDIPPVLTASQMIYSHVTGKFYVFGGFQSTGTVGSNGETYELTISEDSGTLTAAWRKLDTTNGMTCNPECPSARRGHGMVEVNYVSNTATQEDTFSGICTAEAPCSYGIFMEGGTSDGSTLLSDRWMFDPTAHAGAGHWQQVGDFPPRKLGTLAAVTFESLGGGTKNWAVSFGGESGLDTPEKVQAGHFYVPPTFGDTMIYDFESNSWNRMKILGQGFVNETDDTLDVTTLSQQDRRQAYSIEIDEAPPIFRRPTGFSTADLNTLSLGASAPTIADLAPPPLSGAVMVTRTQPQARYNAATTVTPLTIPEIYLIGGRLKDGLPQPLQDVWKLCVASPGERIPIAGGTDDATCDAYDTSTNVDSPAPLSEYSGRWIHKQDSTFAARGSYLGAGAYDSQFDRVVLYGGINSVDSGTLKGITNSATRVLNDAILEYTPPSKIAGTDPEYNGTWDEIPHCTDTSDTALTTPTARYGHSMSYDPVQKRLIVTGGFDSAGNPLTQTVSTQNPEGTYTAPEVWTASRIVEAGTYHADGNGDGIGSDPSESNPCYAWRQITIFGNSTEIITALPPQTSIGLAASVFIPPTGYNTGYYSMFDDQCVGQGPFAGSDALTSKQFAGGAYIDVDRTVLGERENLLLNLTYLPMGTKNQRPDGQLYSREESAFFKIHLISTGETQSQLQAALQPRHLWYTSETEYPKIVNTIDVLAPPDGSPRTDQIVIPLGIDSTIDRIRIERVSGSAILIDAALFRMGPQ